MKRIENIPGSSQKSLVWGHRKKDLFRSGRISETSFSTGYWAVSLVVFVLDVLSVSMCTLLLLANNEKLWLHKETSDCNHIHSSLSFSMEKNWPVYRTLVRGNVYINLSLSKYLGTCVFFVKGSIPAHLTYLWSLSARPVPGCLRFQCGPGLRQAHLSRAERHSVSPMPRSWKGGSQRLWNQILNQIASFHWYLPLPERFCFSICFSWGHQPPLPVLGLWGDRAWGFSFTPT